MHPKLMAKVIWYRRCCTKLNVCNKRGVLVCGVMYIYGHRFWKFSGVWGREGVLIDGLISIVRWTQIFYVFRGGKYDIGEIKWVLCCNWFSFEWRGVFGVWGNSFFCNNHSRLYLFCRGVLLRELSIVYYIHLTDNLSTHDSLTDGHTHPNRTVFFILPNLINPYHI